jgi:PleD family two-component response regulator
MMTMSGQRAEIMAKKIMVIDRDPGIAEYVISVLQDNGFETCAACNEIEAYRKVSDEKPDLIALNFEMTEEWDTGFFSRLSKEGHLRDIPVIAMSNLTDRRNSIPKVLAHLPERFDREQILDIIDVLSIRW